MFVNQLLWKSRNDADVANRIIEHSLLEDHPADSFYIESKAKRIPRFGDTSNPKLKVEDSRNPLNIENDIIEDGVKNQFDILDTESTAEEDAGMDDDNTFDDDTNKPDNEDNGEDQQKPGEESDDIDRDDSNMDATEKNTEEDIVLPIDSKKQAPRHDGRRNGASLVEAYQQALKRKNNQEGHQPQRLTERQQAREGRRNSFKPRLNYVKDWKPPAANITDVSDYHQYDADSRIILPSMVGPQGGVVFFLHVPKTGGQTIRQLSRRFRMHLQRQKGGRMKKQRRGPMFGQYNRHHRRLGEAMVGPSKEEISADHPSTSGMPLQAELEMLSSTRIKYVAANTLEVFQKQAIPQINHYFESAGRKDTLHRGVDDPQQRKILFVEVHGMDNYHALELEPYLHFWRERANQTGVPFFAFTLIREAISMQVSFFNYYYIHPGDFRFCINPLKPNLKCGQQEQKQQYAGGDMKSLLSAFLRGRRGGRALAEETQPKVSASSQESLNRDWDEKIAWLRQKKEAYSARKREGGGEGGLQNGIGRLPRQDGRLRDEIIRRKTPKMNHANGIPNVSHDRLEEVLLQVVYRDPQCLFLARGERTYGDEPFQKASREDPPLQRAECQQTYLSMQRSMDWIGRTDTISSETLPLLTRIMFGKHELGLHLPKANTSPLKDGYVELSKLRSSTHKLLEKKSQLDQELYHRAGQDYAMDQWAT